MNCEHRDDAGAWVLGALADDDRERFAAHLAGCEVCRREVADLQMVADTLPLAAPHVAPPPELKERIMSVVRAEAAGMRTAEAPAEPAAPPAARRARTPEKRRAWWQLLRPVLRPMPAAIAAALVLAIGVGGGVLISGGDQGRTVTAEVVAPSSPGARASLTTEDDRVTLRVRDFPPPPAGRVYQVWLKRPGRPPDPTNALFTTRDGDATVEVPGSVAGVEQVLVTAEPDGGSLVPTRDPVIIASPA
jgi:anti-sigma-K factor RskA